MLLTMKIIAKVLSPLSPIEGQIVFSPRGRGVEITYQIPLVVPRRFKLVVQQVASPKADYSLIGPFPDDCLIELGIVRGTSKGIKGKFNTPGDVEAFMGKLLVIYDMDQGIDPRIEKLRNRHGIPIAYAIVGSGLDKKRAIQA
jgi:hypothetical protein